VAQTQPRQRPVQLRPWTARVIRVSMEWAAPAAFAKRTIGATDRQCGNNAGRIPEQPRSALHRSTNASATPASLARTAIVPRARQILSVTPEAPLRHAVPLQRIRHNQARAIVIPGTICRMARVRSALPITIAR
jgi:hypothetical protein